MEMNEFIEKFAEAVDMDAAGLTPETEFRALDEWDSLSYLSVIAMMDEEYECQIETAEFKQLKTLAALAEFIETHK
ncbi:MAG: acyl carrier protein [Bacteroidaceae bacterium]|jgi:acyl carrier protein|nr:acyl carrier protein [Bacteroidaceae bacterium]